MNTKMCEICGQHIYGAEKNVHYPDSMNLYQSKCIEERNIAFEAVTGRKTKTKVNYYRCPNCGKEILKSNKSN